jgi:hypothetical protein
MVNLGGYESQKHKIRGRSGGFVYVHSERQWLRLLASGKVPVTYGRQFFYGSFPFQIRALMALLRPRSEHLASGRTSVHFLPLIGTFDALNVIEVFPDGHCEYHFDGD